MIKIELKPEKFNLSINLEKLVIPETTIVSVANKLFKQSEHPYSGFGSISSGETTILNGHFLAGKVIDSAFVEMHFPLDSMIAIYKGALQNGHATGKGILQFGKGSCFDGYWKEGLPLTGNLVLVRSAWVYETVLVNGKFIGDWTVKSLTDKSLYKGSLVNGKREGSGFQTFDSPIFRSYEGGWKKDRFEGVGTLTYQDGRILKGEWKKGSITKGDYFATAISYQGEWKNWRPHGQGSFQKGAQTYRGAWSKGFADGMGLLIILKKGEYQGLFLKGSLQFGSWKDSSGKTYQGYWQDWKPHGAGKFTVGLNFYEGSWVQGLPEGPGKMKIAEQTCEGLWKSGVYYSKDEDTESLTFDKLSNSENPD